jgi:DNA-binding XRE family transcriptional regulator
MTITGAQVRATLGLTQEQLAYANVIEEPSV